MLGVEVDADLDEIKRAYKRLAREWHPDANPAEAVNALAGLPIRFHSISDAWEILGDPDLREEYNERRPPKPVAAPSIIDFGRIERGQSSGAPQRVVLTNIGGGYEDSFLSADAGSFWSADIEGVNRDGIVLTIDFECVVPLDMPVGPQSDRLEIRLDEEAVYVDLFVTVKDCATSRSTASPPPPPLFKPTVSFTWLANELNVTVDASATKTDPRSTVAPTFTCVWGDGASSSLSSPMLTHTYARADTYTVSVTVVDAGGSGSAAQTITVYQKPVISDFDWKANGLEVFVRGVTVPPGTNPSLSYDWDDGSKTISSSHRYAGVGDYKLTVFATNPAGTCSLSKTISINLPPVINHFRVVADGLAAKRSGDIAPGLKAVIVVDWGDGHTDDLDTHAYASPGTYDVTLTVSNPCGSATARDTLTVTQETIKQKKQRLAAEAVAEIAAQLDMAVDAVVAQRHDSRQPKTQEVTGVLAEGRSLARDLRIVAQFVLNPEFVEVSTGRRLTMLTDLISAAGSRLDELADRTISAARRLRSNGQQEVERYETPTAAVGLGPIEPAPNEAARSFRRQSVLALIAIAALVATLAWEMGPYPGYRGILPALLGLFLIIVCGWTVVVWSRDVREGLDALRQDKLDQRSYQAALNTYNAAVTRYRREEQERSKSFAAALDWREHANTVATELDSLSERCRSGAQSRAFRVLLEYELFHPGAASAMPPPGGHGPPDSPSPLPNVSRERPPSPAPKSRASATPLPVSAAKHTRRRTIDVFSGALILSLGILGLVATAWWLNYAGNSSFSKEIFSNDGAGRPNWVGRLFWIGLTGLVPGVPSMIATGWGWSLMVDDDDIKGTIGFILAFCAWALMTFMILGP